MYKKRSSFSFIAVLFVPCLSEHKRPGAIGMLEKLGCVFLTSRNIIIAFHQLYSASEIGIRLQGQLNIQRRSD